MTRFGLFLCLLPGFLLLAVDSLPALTEKDLLPDQVFRRGHFVGKEKREKKPIRFAPFLDLEKHDDYYALDVFLSFYHHEENRKLAAQGHRNAKTKYLVLLYQRQFTPIYDRTMIAGLFYSRLRYKLSEQLVVRTNEQKYGHLLLPYISWGHRDTYQRGEGECEPGDYAKFNFNFLYLYARNCQDYRRFARRHSFLFYWMQHSSAPRQTRSWFIPLWFYSRQQNKDARSKSLWLLPPLFISHSKNLATKSKSSLLLFPLFYQSSSLSAGNQHSSLYTLPFWFSSSQVGGQEAYSTQLFYLFYHSHAQRNEQSSTLLIPLFHTASGNSRTFKYHMRTVAPFFHWSGHDEKKPDGRSHRQRRYLVGNFYHSAEGERKHLRYFTTFWPIWYRWSSQDDSLSRNLLLPLFWTSHNDTEYLKRDSYLIAPFFYRHRQIDRKTKEEVDKHFYGLYWSESSGKPGDQQHFRAILPFYYSWRHDRSKNRTNNILPLYYYKYQEREKGHAETAYYFPLFYSYRQKSAELDKSQRLIGIYWRSDWRRKSGDSSFTALFPLYYNWAKANPERNTTFFMPFYYQNRYIASDNWRHTNIVPPLVFYWNRSKDKEGYHNRWLATLLWRSRNIDANDDVTMWALLPIYYDWSGNDDYSQTVIFPFFWRKSEPKYERGYIYPLAPFIWLDYSRHEFDLRVHPIFTWYNYRALNGDRADDLESRNKYSLFYFVYRHWNESNKDEEYSATDLIWPWIAWKNDREERHVRVFPLVWFNYSKIDSTETFIAPPVYLAYDDSDEKYRLWFPLYGEYHAYKDFRIRFFIGPLIMARRYYKEDLSQWDIAWPLIKLWKKGIESEEESRAAPVSEKPSTTTTKETVATAKQYHTMNYALPLFYWEDHPRFHRHVGFPVYWHFSGRYTEHDDSYKPLSGWRQTTFWLPVYGERSSLRSQWYTVLFPGYFNYHSYGLDSTRENLQKENYRLWFLLGPALVRRIDRLRERSSWDFPYPIVHLRHSKIAASEAKKVDETLFYALPLYWRQSSALRYRHILFPIYWYSQKFDLEKNVERSRFITILPPLYVANRNQYKWWRSVLWPMYAQSGSDNHRFLMVLGPTFVKRNDDYAEVDRYHFLFPFGYYRSYRKLHNKLGYFIPLWWYARDDDSHTKVLLPMYISHRSRWTDWYTVAWPLFYRSQDMVRDEADNAGEKWKVGSELWYLLGPVLVHSHDRQSRKRKWFFPWPLFKYESKTLVDNSHQSFFYMIPLLWWNSGNESNARIVGPIYLDFVTHRSRINGKTVEKTFTAVLPPVFFSYRSPQYQNMGILFPLFYRSGGRRIRYRFDAPNRKVALEEGKVSLLWPLWGRSFARSLKPEQFKLEREYLYMHPLFYHSSQVSGTSERHERSSVFTALYLFWLTNAGDRSPDYQAQSSSSTLVPIWLSYQASSAAVHYESQSNLKLLLPLWFRYHTDRRDGRNTRASHTNVVVPFWITHKSGSHHELGSTDKDRLIVFPLYWQFYSNRSNNGDDTRSEYESGARYLLPLYLRSWRESMDAGNGRPPTKTITRRYGIFWPLIQGKTTTRDNKEVAAADWYLYPILGGSYDNAEPGYETAKWRILAPLLGGWRDSSRGRRESGVYWLWPLGNYTTTRLTHEDSRRLITLLPFVYHRTTDQLTPLSENRRKLHTKWDFKVEYTGRTTRTIVLPVYFGHSISTKKLDDYYSTLVPLYYYGAYRYAPEGAHSGEDSSTLLTIPFWYFGKHTSTKWYFAWPVLKFSSKFAANADYEYDLTFLWRVVRFYGGRQEGGEYKTDYNLLSQIVKYEERVYRPLHHERYFKLLGFLKLYKSYQEDNLYTTSVLPLFGYEREDKEGYSYRGLSILLILYKYSHEIDARIDRTKHSILWQLYKYEKKNDTTTHRFLHFIKFTFDD